MQKNLLQIILTTIFVALSITACGPSPMGYTVTEFESEVQKLHGKSKDDVIKAIGEPKHITQNETDGKPFDCFTYEGIKSTVNGKLSRGSTICFLDGKLVNQTPAHSF